MRYITRMELSAATSAPDYLPPPPTLHHPSPVVRRRDMTECVPKFNFAPQRTFTIGDAARAAGLGIESMFEGKW